MVGRMLADFITIHYGSRNKQNDWDNVKAETFPSKVLDVSYIYNTLIVSH